jgi:hypothetical protein
VHVYFFFPFFSEANWSTTLGRYIPSLLTCKGSNNRSLMCKCKHVDGKSHYMKEENMYEITDPMAMGVLYLAYRPLEFLQYLPRNHTTLKLTITHRNFPISDSHGNQVGPWMLVSPMNEKKKAFPNPITGYVIEAGSVTCIFFRYINLSPAAIGSAKGAVTDLQYVIYRKMCPYQATIRPVLNVVSSNLLKNTAVWDSEYIQGTLGGVEVRICYM